MKKLLPIWYCKGATCYELQVARVIFRWCHLKGFPDCRLSFRLETKEERAERMEYTK